MRFCKIELEEILSRKCTYDEISDMVSGLGFRLISNYYIGIREKVDVQDMDGYMYHVQLGNLLDGRPPKKYRNTNKYTIYNLQHFIKANHSNTTVLSETYEDAHKRLLFRCGECGEKYEASLNHVVSRKQLLCPKCSLRHKGMRHRVSIENVVSEFEKSGLIPLFDTYDGCDEKLLCKDIDGNLLRVSYRSLAQRNKDGYFTYRLSYSKYESMVSDYLKMLEIDFIPQYTFKDCMDSKRLRFDFAVFLCNGVMMLIEVDGEQHFSPICFGGDKDENLFIELKKRDAIKNRYCEEHGIDLLRLPYFLFKNEGWKNIIKNKIEILQNVAM